MIHRQRVTIELQQEPELCPFGRPKGNPDVETRDFWAQMDESRSSHWPSQTPSAGGAMGNWEVILRAPWPQFRVVKPGDRIVAVDGEAVPVATVVQVFRDGVSMGRQGIHIVKAVRDGKGPEQ